jgi:cytochrome P450
VITLTAFTLAMIKSIEVQRKAQEAIDRVVGNDRLPTFGDREKLLYINAVVKEATRWRPIVPMGFLHVATETFYHEGFRISKDALLLPAVWWFLRVPSVYLEPESFDPERFLPPRDEPDPGAKPIAIDDESDLHGSSSMLEFTSISRRRWLLLALARLLTRMEERLRSM